jgi:hypothetical protein
MTTIMIDVNRINVLAIQTVEILYSFIVGFLIIDVCVGRMAESAMKI